MYVYPSEMGSRSYRSYEVIIFTGHLLISKIQYAEA